MLHASRYFAQRYEFCPRWRVDSAQAQRVPARPDCFIAYAENFAGKNPARLRERAPASSRCRLLDQQCRKAFCRWNCFPGSLALYIEAVAVELKFGLHGYPLFAHSSKISTWHNWSGAHQQARFWPRSFANSVSNRSGLTSFALSR